MRGAQRAGDGGERTGQVRGFLTPLRRIRAKCPRDFRDEAIDQILPFGTSCTLHWDRDIVDGAKGGFRVCQFVANIQKSFVSFDQPLYGQFERRKSASCRRKRPLFLCSVVDHLAIQ
jgi:hypothetical protein